MSWGIVIGIAILLAIPFLAWKTAADIFRSGRDEEYLSGFPVFSALFYTFGIALSVSCFAWLTDSYRPGLLPSALWMAGICLAFGSALWLVGFFFGRRRAARNLGVLSHKG